MKVQAVLTGRILHQGNDLAVQTDLVKVEDGTQIWGKQFTRGMQDITQELTAALKSRLAGNMQDMMAARSKESAGACQLLLQGRYHLVKRTPDDLKAALDFYQRAVAAEPNNPEAYAGLAIANVVAPSYIKDRSTEFVAAAETAARRALQLAQFRFPGI